MVFRSVLQPGWSWREHIQLMTRGLENCRLHHREDVAGRIRYDTVEGGSFETGAGTYLDIAPGHLASVVATRPVSLVDWGEDWG